MLKAEAKKIAALYGIKESLVGGADIDDHLFPNRPGLVLRDSGLLRLNFSIIPSWSPQRKIKYATYNARVEDIESKPSFRDSFVKRHCIVPLTAFIEPIYEGAYGGHMVAFSENKILSAAGIWDAWVDKKSGEEIESFAIITTSPYPFVESIGHDRSPLFLKDAAALDWLSLSSRNPIEIKNFLFENQLQIDAFEVSKVRALKKTN